MEPKRKPRERVLFVRVSDAEHDRVMVAADNLGVSASGFIRMAVARALRDDTLAKAAEANAFDTDEDA